MAARLPWSSGRFLLRQIRATQDAAPRGVQINRHNQPKSALPTSSCSRRAISTSHARASNAPNQDYPGQDRSRETPARAHRASMTSAMGQGAGVDPMSGEPRNASAGAAQEARRGEAETLAEIATSAARFQGGNSDRPGRALDSLYSPTVRAAQAEVAPRKAQQEDQAEIQPQMAPSGYTATQLAVREDPFLCAFVNNLMSDGKKAMAQRHVLDMMNYLAKVLHANPLPALQSAIQTASPFARTRSRKMGGKSIQVPLMLNEKQGRRRAIVGIIEASKKRSDSKIGVRLGKEIIAILEGTSSTIQKKEEMHRIAMVNRGNTTVRI